MRFISWCNEYEDQDFRRVVVAHANFLYCQASQIDPNLASLSLWDEIHPTLLTAVPEQLEHYTTSAMFAIANEGSQKISRRKTTVTPYVYDCFKHLPWARFLYCQTPSVGLYAEKALFSSDSDRSDPRRSATCVTPVTSCNGTVDQHSVSPGDVVTLPRDKDSAWSTDDPMWYAYVQGVHDTAKGRRLSLLWLYRASDTQCLQMHYPFANEMFLSDHCNCGDLPVYASEVSSRVSVSFFGGPETKEVEFFVRQRYIQGDGAWETLKDADFTCPCRSSDESYQYSVGDTLLVRLERSLEPVVVDACKSEGKILPSLYACWLIPQCQNTCCFKNKRNGLYQIFDPYMLHSLTSHLSRSKWKIPG